ncbi:MAG: M28 family peptidase [Bacteroidota bacterium]
MKKILILLIINLFAFQLFASELVIIPTKSYDETKKVFENPDLKVHFFRDDFVIATSSGEYIDDFILIDNNPWQTNTSYYLVYVDSPNNKSEYVSEVEKRADILYDGDYYLIVRSDESKFGQLPPAKNDGMVRIFERRARLPEKQEIFNNLKITEQDAFIVELMNEVNASYITEDVQHLEDYITRNAYAVESQNAQDWIEDQFLNLGLDVEVMDFTMPDGPASDNVIATQIGTTYPDEYIVLGGHYDSYSYSGDAPGADDNASGTSGVLEIARILSEHEFDRSIIFCAFSGEEYGLYGSAAYAHRCAQQGMDILAYFNMDMIAYLEPGNSIMKSSLIYPNSAQDLADFYTQVASVYLPDFDIAPANFTGGDSDHTSFNNNGFMGIFPFEDIDNYSPYIHTYEDVVGLSYNNEDQAVVFTQAVLASVVTMSKTESQFATSLHKEEIVIYPNPATDKTLISIASGKTAELIITNISGQQVMKTPIVGSIEIELSHLPGGMYLVHIAGIDFKETHKLLVQ